MSNLNRIKNAIPALVLRSPAHALMSGKYLIVHFTGRKTGRRYSTPVAYVRHGKRLIVSTDSPWWRNLDGRECHVTLRGARGIAHGARIVDHDRAAELLGRLVAEVPGYARPAGLPTHRGRVSPDDIVRAVATDRVVLALDVSDARR